MSNTYFQFKKFTIQQDHCAMKVTTDSCLFGAWAAERVQSLESGITRILDIGAGTGLLSLMVAQKNKTSIDAIEIDKDAFEQAKENFTASPWASQLNIFNADTREFIFSSPYDIIICNPPFYKNELRSPDSKRNIARHDGLAMDELLQIIRKNLAPPGQFYLLLPYKRNAEIDKLITSNNLSIQHKTLVRQSPDHDHFRIMITGSHKTDKEEITLDEICIQNNQQQYTVEFISLLNEYYLALRANS